MHIGVSTVKSLMTNNAGVQHSWRSRLALVFGLGLALTAAACAGGGSATSPSGVSPSSLDARGGNAGGNSDKTFTVTVSPASVLVGPATLTVVVSNVSASTQQLGSVRIEVPAGLTVTSVGSFSGAKTWQAVGAISQTVTVGATGGTQKLEVGESVTFQIGVTSTICALNTFATPQGSNETPGTFVSEWVYSGAVPAVTVTGCALECPAAPSIAAAYLHSIGLKPNDDDYRNYVAQVAEEMGTEASFNGLLPCDSGYAAAVIAFLVNLGAV